MSYLHCHNCNWSQDDFWTFKINYKKLFNWKSRPFGYNPLSLILEDIAGFIKPRSIKIDPYSAKEYGFKNNKVFSWKLCLFEIKYHIKCMFTQKYWTYNSFKKAYNNNKAFCPKCNSRQHLDID